MKKVDEIKIGYNLPLTGSNSSAGLPTEAVFKMVADQVNSSGGIKSLGGAKIKLVGADSQSKVDVGVAEMERLVREGVSLILGSYSSTISFATSQVAEKAGVPNILDEAVASNILARGFKNVFRVIADGRKLAEGGVNFTRQLSDVTGESIKNVVLMHENTNFGSDLAKIVQAYAPSKGFTLVDVIPYAPTAVSLTAEVSRAKAAKADVLWGIGYYGDGVLMARAVKEQKAEFKALIGVSQQAWTTPRFTREEPAVADRIFTNNHNWDPNWKELAQMKQAIPKFGTEWNQEAYCGYVTIKTAIDAIERAASTDRDAIRDAITKTNLKIDAIPGGPVVFDETGQNKNAPTVLMQILDQQIKVVLPEQYAQAKPQFPVKTGA